MHTAIIYMYVLFDCACTWQIWHTHIFKYVFCFLIHNVILPGTAPYCVWNNYYPCRILQFLWIQYFFLFYKKDSTSFLHKGTQENKRDILEIKGQVRVCLNRLRGNQAEPCTRSVSQKWRILWRRKSRYMKAEFLNI